MKPISAHQLPGVDNDIERLCDFFAAAMLMPRHALGAYARSDHDVKEHIANVLTEIPDAARHFGVPERVAADRLSYQISKLKFGIIGVRRVEPTAVSLLGGAVREQSSFWQLSWCTLPGVSKLSDLPAAHCLPGLGGTKVRIPDEMVPKWADSSARSGMLDIRWWDLVTPHQKYVRRTPLRHRESAHMEEGVARKVKNRMYVALPL